MSHKKFEGPPLYSQMSSPEWERWFTLIANTLSKIDVFNVAINPDNISANSTAEQSVTITGVRTGDTVLSVSKPTHTTGLGIVNYRVSAADTVAITFMNNTASDIDASSETYKIVVLRG